MGTIFGKRGNSAEDVVDEDAMEEYAMEEYAMEEYAAEQDAVGEYAAEEDGTVEYAVQEGVVEEGVVEEGVVEQGAAEEEDAAEEEEDAAEEEDAGEEDSVEGVVVPEVGKRKGTEDHENPQEKRRRLDSIRRVNDLHAVAQAGKRKPIGDRETSKERRRRLYSIRCVNNLHAIAQAGRRRPIADRENSKEKRRRLDNFRGVNELHAVAQAGKRKTAEDNERSKERRRRLYSIRCVNNLHAVAQAGKRKAEDHETPQQKYRRLDNIRGVNESPAAAQAGKRKTAEDNERSKERRRRLYSIRCVDALHAVAQAGKGESTGDHQNPQPKHRRLANIRCDDEMPSTSQDTDSRNEPVAVQTQRSPKRKAIAHDEPGERMAKRKKKRALGPAAMFKSKYQQQDLLGEGGFGVVFAGYRKTDYLDVAIKHMPRANEIVYAKEDVTGKRIPLEVAVMLKLASISERHSAHVGLLDWYELQDEVILVMERPMPAVSLLDYIEEKGGRLKEKEAKLIMKQLVDAAMDLQEKHIFHRDIKVENVLIQTCQDGMRVRIIDFGASCFFKEGDIYEYFMGTHVPPECFSQEYYTAGPSTVFQMGVVLFDMIQATSFRWHLFYKEGQKIKGRLSKNCRHILKACLHENPNQRPTLQQLRDHPWLK